MGTLYLTDAPKKATNLSVNSDLLRLAREYGINLSATLEEALEAKVRKEKEKRWLEETREAVEEYNDYIRKHGTLAMRIRRK